MSALIIMRLFGVKCFAIHVEDAFGVSKGRFRILKLPIQLHDKKKIYDLRWSGRAIRGRGGLGLEAPEGAPSEQHLGVRSIG